MRTYWHTNNLWYREEVGRYVPFPSVNLERQRVCRRNERKMGENTGVLKRVPLFPEPSRMDLEAFAKKRTPRRSLVFVKRGGGERLSRNIVKTTVNIAIYDIHAPHKGCDFFVHYFSLSSLTTASAPWTVTHPCL